MNKPVYLGLSILESNKILMYEFWYDYVDPKYGEDVETRFQTSDHVLDRPLPKGKNIEVIGVMEDQLGGKIMIEFVRLRGKNYSYLIDDRSEEKKSKRQKKVCHKRKEATQIDSNIYYLEKKLNLT